MVMGLRLAAGQPDQVRAQDHLRVQRHISTQALAHLDGACIETQLFAELAGQRGGFTLPGMTLPPGSSQRPASSGGRRRCAISTVRPAADSASTAPATTIWGDMACEAIPSYRRVWLC